MNSMISQHVRRIIADLFSMPFGQISLESSPDLIDAWDSLQHLNLVLALEQELGVQFTPEEIEQLSSVERIETLIEIKLQCAGKAL